MSNILNYVWGVRKSFNNGIANDSNFVRILNVLHEPFNSVLGTPLRDGIRKKKILDRSFTHLWIMTRMGINVEGGGRMKNIDVSAKGIKNKPAPQGKGRLLRRDMAYTLSYLCRFLQSSCTLNFPKLPLGIGEVCNK